ncbi:TPA: hypothetical protein MFM44_003377 [Klebsiella pneumoniae]|uniref:Uncharacterized protein n=1 Tax=Klebsiella pneumoniae TaxID=573 RepID=A0A483KUN2_KLEPN|nr:hypothetical protein B4U29_11780 [Klebsiella pneumoniae]PZB59530.1 hypothetical protein C3J88_18685 [Klebsiella pneumoniae subsp. pneumoniae]HBW8913467.1 hypothetical protein [Klebsiella pneumoniae subsp. pneumoniae 1158]SAU53252.1 Uncharacterised protein [Klebsiella pneumoniae]SBG81524.1 Uncharacterised protein [Klebsiella pneumoniae]
MDNQELKHVIALLLEDSKRLQELEPNVGTEARILLAKQALKTDEAKSHTRANLVTHKITPLPCKGDGVDRVYHETMVKCLRIELERLRSQIVIHEIVTN